MVTFSHTDAGTAESEWEASGLAVLPELPLDAGELAAMTFIVLAAHPDDETLGAGGFLSRLHAAGAAVDVLLCTAGEASHPESRTTTPEQLAAVRLGEFGEALSELVPAASWRFLHLPDGRLAADRHRIARGRAGSDRRVRPPGGTGGHRGALPRRRPRGPRRPGFSGGGSGGGRRPRAAGIPHLVLAVGIARGLAPGSPGSGCR